MQPNVADRLGVILTGRVQGVGFRWWALREADSLGLRGTVRNHPDGSVEVHAAGPAEALATFLAALRRGPSSANVTGVRTVPSIGQLPHHFRVIR
jgi:acylphosphatase